MNRHDRRAAASASRRAGRHLKLRCVCCDRTGKEMTKEHYWPRRLAQRAKLKHDGVQWLDGKWIGPGAATIPLCADCNHRLGSDLEAPVAVAFEEMEAGKGLSDAQAELLVRWLWKFEGLIWSAEYSAHPNLVYSELWTVRDRVLGGAINNVRGHLILAASFFEANDEGFTALPVGLDSGISERNAVFVSGVFCRTALMVLLAPHAGLIPSQFGTYSLKPVKDASGEKVFFPPTNFKTAREAIRVTKYASGPLTAAHEEYARRRDGRPRLILPSRRVELP